MSKLNGTTSPSKKRTRKIIYSKLSASLAEYTGQLSSKKLERRLRKISKDLAGDIRKAAKKENGKLQKLKVKGATNKKVAVTEPNTTTN
jgi:hypothetical protein